MADDERHSRTSHENVRWSRGRASAGNRRATRGVQNRESARMRHAGGRTGHATRIRAEEHDVEHLLVVAGILVVATFATGVLLPRMARRADERHPVTK
jgi:hypothetical protein